VRAAIEQYLQRLEFEQRASHHTLQAYKTDLDQFLAVISTQLGITPSPHDISQDLIQRYSEWLHDQGYRKSTISRKFAALRSFLQYLGDIGYKEDPAIVENLRVPYEPRKVPRMLERDELERLLVAPRAGHSPGALRDAAILALLYEGGFRATELVRLRLADVLLNQARIRHPAQPDESVSIPASIDILRAYLQDGRPHLVRDPFEDVLFLNQRGKGLTRQGLWLVVKRWAAAAGIKGSLSPHTLRHTRARDLLMRGINRREVQRFLGLSSPNAIRIHTKSETDED
jgi:integrase/recombinase XerD